MLPPGTNPEQLPSRWHEKVIGKRVEAMETCRHYISHDGLHTHMVDESWDDQRHTRQAVTIALLKQQYHHQGQGHMSVMPHLAW